ncbi:hypothetical protein PM082_007412 [Marasmius tenuissimus]|nr:hypothetical protein PM082_007412 [Marasmius tenuissimus]
MGIDFSTLLPVTGISLCLIWILQRRRNSPNLPPGPPSDPIIGHLRIMPNENQADVFREWSKVYGDVMYLSIPIFDRQMVVLGNIEVAQELLENRGAIYSCRPKFILLNDLVGWNPALTFQPYKSKRFAKHRKMYSAHFGKKESMESNLFLAEEARLLVKNLYHESMDKGDRGINGLRYVHRLTVSNIMRAAYGHQVKSEDDVFMGMAERVSHFLNNCGPPGNTPVDLMPWLRHLPSWLPFPGRHYIKLARDRWYRDVRELHDFPINFVREGMKSKTIQKCLMSDNLEKLGERDPTTGSNLEEELEDIKSAAATIFAAGEDTTYVTLSTFFLAMIQNPDIQRRVHEEIISVVGEDRLPDVTADRESLRYLECVLQEVLRWHSSVPLGVPHRSLEDDVYNGMFIPKGTIIIANIRGMARDERVYSDPAAFDPSRFLPVPEGRGEPFSPSIWGFGRRICPGRHFADLVIWNVAACTLATLEILPPKNERGNVIIPELVTTEGLTSGVAPFNFYVRPRSEKARALIAEIED